MILFLSGCLLLADPPPDASIKAGPWKSVGTLKDKICAVNGAGKLACVQPYGKGARWIDRRETYTDIDAWGSEVCALSSEGAALCGVDGESTDLSYPKNADAFDRLTVSDDAACVFRGDTPTCFGGSNADDRISLTPEEDILDAAFYDDFGASINMDGELRTWGSNPDLDQLPATSYTELATTDAALCGMTSTGTFCTSGRLVRYESLQGTDLQGAQVSYGDYLLCAIGDEGRVNCVGENADHQADPPDGAFVDLDVAGDYACGVTQARRVRCWGAAAEFPFEVGVSMDSWL